MNHSVTTKSSRIFTHCLRVLVILTFVLSFSGGTVAFAGLNPAPAIAGSQSGIPGLPEIQSYTAGLIHTVDLALIDPPSPDPAGITYIPSRNSLLVVDPEVEETKADITHFEGINAWELSLAGSVLHTGNLSTVPYPETTPLSMTDEPNGAAWNPNTGHFLITDDKAEKVFDLDPGADGVPGTADDGDFTSFSTVVAGFTPSDPEGVAYDPVDDRILVVDETNAEVFLYTPAGSLISHFDIGVFGLVEVEGIDFYAPTGTVFVMGAGLLPKVVETTTDGQLLQEIDIRAGNPYKPSGLAIGPASSGSGATHMYIVARGIDNDFDPNEIDGKLFELTFNASPLVDAGPDQSIMLTDGAVLDGTVTDDGVGTITTVWSQVSGPGTVTFDDASAVDTTAAFSEEGVYVLRLTATDGAGTRSDELTVQVARYRTYLSLVFNN